VVENGRPREEKKNKTEGRGRTDPVPVRVHPRWESCSVVLFHRPTRSGMVVLEYSN